MHTRIILTSAFIVLTCGSSLCHVQDRHEQPHTLTNPELIKLEVKHRQLELDEAPEVLLQPFTTQSKIYFRLQATNWSLKPATLLIFDRYFQNRLELVRDGRPTPYKEHIKTLLEAKEKDPFTRMTQAVNLEPDESRVIEFIDLADWYDRLQPGHYQLSIKHRFEPEQDWIESSSLTFEVVPNTRENRSSVP